MRPGRVEQSSSVDHAPSLGVRPNVQTGFAPKVEETLGHCRKPHMGTGALRARKAAHRRVTPVGSVPSVHSGYADMVCGAGPRSGGLGVRIVISSDTSCIVYDTLDVETVTWADWLRPTWSASTLPLTLVVSSPVAGA